MKKLLYIVAVATLAFISCQRQELDSTNDEAPAKALTFKASIEQLEEATKGTINSSNQLVWAENDLIGIYFPDWGDKNQPFRLNAADAGSTQGTFTIATAANPSGASATAAYYPYDPIPDPVTATPAYPSDSQNHVYDNVVYYNLKNEYWSYDNGDMLTPLVASISSPNDNINFKHAGGAVKLTLNNLPTGTYKVKMTVVGQQITGYYNIPATSAGTAAMTVNSGADNTANNNITLNTWKSNGVFSWIFPVPELTTPKLQFEVKDENGIIVWSKNKLKAQKNDIGRGDILEMPTISISPYEQFSTTADWSVCGDSNSWGDTKMVTDGKLCIAKSVTFAANNQFKVRTLGAWTTSYGWDELNKTKSINIEAGTENNNIKVKTAGTYDIIFNSSDSEYCGYAAHEIRVVKSKYPYPLPAVSASIIINGTFTDWDDVPAESSGNTTAKVISDNKNVYFYVQLTNVAGTVWGSSNSYLYVLFDLDGDPSNDVDQWGNKGDFVALLYPYGGTSETPALVTSASSSTNTWLCKPNTSSYTIENVKLDGTISSGTVTYEFSIPRDDMPAIPTTGTVTITLKGNPMTSSVNLTRSL